MLPDALVIRNTTAEGAGNLGYMLDDDGFDVTCVDARREALPDSEPSLVVILGAPYSANDSLPHLAAEQDLIRRCVARNVPLLGICLGSQLVARALGAPVYRGRMQEIGFYDDLRIEGEHDLLSGFDDPFTVFHWHGDTFDLPDAATRLASSALYRNQAFTCGSAVGLQFHIEVTRDMVDQWLGNACDMLAGLPHVDPHAIRSQIDEKMPIVESNMRTFYRNFASAYL